MCAAGQAAASNDSDPVAEMMVVSSGEGTSMSRTVDLAYPFTGRWLVQNSPANRAPSHGTTAFASSYAIDFVPVGATGRTARFGLGSLVHPEPAEHFPGFARPVLAPAEGVVVVTHDDQSDHPAYRGFPSIGYALSQRRRAAAGWEALAGNHVFVDCGDAVVALCHLQQASIVVRPGQHVVAGDLIACCGNSGNSTEPHLHVQAIDGVTVEEATAVRLSFNGELPRNGEIIHA